VRRARLSLGPVRLALLLAGLGACVTSGEGEKMQRDIDRLKQRVDAMDRRDAEINEQVARLRKVLDQATALLSRNSADIGSRVDKNTADLAAASGQIEEAKHSLDELQRKLTDQNGRLAQLEQTQSKIVDRVAPTIPEDKETLWKEAQTRLAGGMRDDARRFLNSFIQRFPQDPRAPQALILVGQSYATEGKHQLAAGAFGKVLDTFPKAAEVPDAMWFMGQSYAELKFCSDSIAILNDLVKRFPKSARVNDAKTKLRELHKIQKDKKFCTS